ncbi:MAG: OFA family MFS transporter [Spirochaetales bacterium]|nr:OFA family MFS transporter [Spirochaetales bacterium]
MELKKRRWIVLIASCIINLCIGTAYAWSVFGKAWALLLGVQTAIAFTLNNSVGPITMISGGKINDVLGPKWVVFAGGLIFGGGSLIAGIFHTFTSLFIGYGIMMGLGMGLVYGCTVNNTVKLFPDKRGLIGGLTTMAYGLGSVILAPVARWMVYDKFAIKDAAGAVTTNGITSTFIVLGIVYMAIICIGAFFTIKVPENYQPEGWTPPPPKPNVRIPKDKNWKEMLADPVFYVMLCMTLSGAFCGLMLISQVFAIATDQTTFAMTSVAAANIVMSLALFNAFGRVTSGWISDKIGRINTLTITLSLAAVGLLLIFSSASAEAANNSLFTVGVCMVGFAFGSTMGVLPGFTADQFGSKNNTMNFGIMFIGFALAGILGPMIMQNMKPTPKTFSNASYIVAVAFAVFGVIMSFVFRAMTKEKSN